MTEKKNAKTDKAPPEQPQGMPEGWGNTDTPLAQEMPPQLNTDVPICQPMPGQVPPAEPEPGKRKKE